MKPGCTPLLKRTVSGLEKEMQLVPPRPNVDDDNLQKKLSEISLLFTLPIGTAYSYFSHGLISKA